VHDEAARTRAARRALPLFGQQGAFVGSVPGYRIGRGSPLTIESGPGLVPVDLSVEFKLTPEQLNDEGVAVALATRAANIVALAEDEVMLKGAGAESALHNLGVCSRNLDSQEGLFERSEKRSEKQSEKHDVASEQVKHPILESILDGIKKLRARNHQGEYAVIVSPDLFEEAFKPRHNTMDAPIYEIRPLLLKDNGFLYSAAAPAKSGVIFSLGGQTIDVNVSVDATAAVAEETRGFAILHVVEQLRLRLNDPTARVNLS
jgi:uncharacterized linocin/CFP29 family protein